MTTKPRAEDAWLSSTETRKKLHVSTCELMHLREAGRMRFSKKGSSFLYLLSDVERLLNVLEVSRSDKRHRRGSKPTEANRPERAG